MDLWLPFSEKKDKPIPFRYQLDIDLSDLCQKSWCERVEVARSETVVVM